MDRETRELLGYSAAIGLIQRCAQSPLGRQWLGELRPGDDAEAIEGRLRLAAQCRDFIEKEERLACGHLERPDEVIDRLRIRHEVLQPDDFMLLLALLDWAAEARRRFRTAEWPVLATLLAPLPGTIRSGESIRRTLDERGEIRENAHPQLAGCRRRQSRLRQEIQSQLERLCRQKPDSVIDDPFVTSRNGRFVIPVRTERQKDVSGVVHAASSSGATVFLEPLTVVAVNNEFLCEQEREQEIIRQVLARLTDSVRDEIDVLRKATEIAAEVDALFAIAEFDRRFRCTLPEFNDRGAMELIEARHPLLTAGLGESKVVPIDVCLSRQTGGMIISGPNTGGKTVALKTAGLLALMAQSGLPVPAKAARLPIFRQVLADIGDHQSIDERLSTFSAHILRLKEILSSLEEPSLVLLDELGTGTDPVYGAALGIAVLRHLRQGASIVLATTHHQALKQYAATTEGMVNACVELDPETFEPTFRIRVGVSGSSSGLQIAEKLGLPGEIIAVAEGLLSDSDREIEGYLDYLRSEIATLRREREDLENAAQELRSRRDQLREAQVQQQERQRKGFEEQLERWSRDFRAETKRAAKAIRDKAEAARVQGELRKREAALKEEFRRRVRQEREASAPQPSGEEFRPKVGDWVCTRLMGQPARVLEIDRDEATLEASGKRLFCRVKDLLPSQGEKPARTLPRNVVLDAVEEAEPELNLIGKNVDEAVDQADKFLDRAFLSSLREVRLVHGYGTGRLRGALSEFLRGHPHVAGFKGEGGATIVRLRD